MDLCTVDAAVGRKPGCVVLYADTTISSIHCKISLASASGQTGLQMWLEDCSVNGTYVNAQKIGRGNKVRLHQDDQIGLLKACGGLEPPPYAFVFKDLTAGLSAADFPLLSGGSGSVAGTPVKASRNNTAEALALTPRMASERDLAATERDVAAPPTNARPSTTPGSAKSTSSAMASAADEFDQVESICLSTCLYIYLSIHLYLSIYILSLYMYTPVAVLRVLSE